MNSSQMTSPGSIARSGVLDAWSPVGGPIRNTEEIALGRLMKPKSSPKAEK
jgi:hypothetical protein